jgi:cyclopropane-fatty-acyl-phospholipid synthase
MKSRIYTGKVMHARMKPVTHKFQYPVYLYAFDLDELEALNKEIPWFGYNRFAPVSIYDKDYLHEGGESIKEKVFRYLEEQHCADGIGRIELVTSARYFHYVFNPVSFYYCYKTNESIGCIVAEVNNTFHERHVYVLNQTSRVIDEHLYRYTQKKAFHVSPFNDLDGNYEFYFANLNGKLDIQINIIKEEQPFFYSRLSGKSTPLSSSNLRKTIMRYPITAWLNMPRILKEAAMLYYQKHLPVYSKPHPSSDMTIRTAKPTFVQRYAMNVLLKLMENIQVGSIEIELPDQSVYTFGSERNGNPLRMQIKHYRVFSEILQKGDIGLGEAYVKGDVETNDLTGLLSFFIHNRPFVSQAVTGIKWFGRVFYRINHWLNKNTKAGSRKNIYNHYDIGNEFYQLILDPTMMYSAAVFESPEQDLASAQKNKMRKLMEKAQINANDHVLEIGSGWGGMAIEMAKTTGCRVTTITVSDEQYKMAVQCVKEEGLDDKIEVKICDYRNIEGQYDKVISIEMIEAVGHEYLGTYFNAIDRALKPNGIAVLQAITIPDQRYDAYRQNSDWIQQYIFPGAVVPSLTAMCNAMTKKSSLLVDQIENYGVHYAKTLNLWQKNLHTNKEKIMKLGMDDRFMRTWQYYFSYCEAAFATRHLNLLHLVVTRQNNLTINSHV